MPDFRVKFRDKKEDLVIDAHKMRESDRSYLFYSDEGNTLAQVPREVVLSAVEEGAVRVAPNSRKKPKA